MWLWLTGKIPSGICLQQGYMATPDSAFFLPAFSLVFPTWLYSAKPLAEITSLFINQ